MAKYYNTSNGSLAVALRSGNSASLPGKQWSNIPSSEEGSEDLINAVKRGFLVRSTIEDDDAAKAAEVSPVAEVAVTPEASPVAELPSALVSLAKPEEVQASPPADPVSPEASSDAPSLQDSVEKTSESRRRKV